MAEESGKALFLAGLSESCEFTDLHEAFEPFGKVVLCRVLKDAKTGKSRRVGYVNFERAEDAMKAMASLQGRPGPGGAPFEIKIAAQDPTFKPQETKKVFVRYVPVNVTVEEVREAFSQFGEIEDCVVLRDLSRTARREPGPWNMAYVTYRQTKDAIIAVAKAAGMIRFCGQELTVKPAVSEETLRLRSKFRQQQQQQQHVHPPIQLPHTSTVLIPSHHQVPQRLAEPAQAVPAGFVPVQMPGVGLVLVPASAIQGAQVPAPQPDQVSQPQFMTPQQLGSPLPMHQQQQQQQHGTGAAQPVFVPNYAQQGQHAGANPPNTYSNTAIDQSQPGQWISMGNAQPMPPQWSRRSSDPVSDVGSWQQ